MNEDIQNLRYIITEMYRIGCEWYKELCKLRKENDELKNNILDELRNQSKWQTDFAENLPKLTEDLLKNIGTNMKNDAAPKFQEVIDKIGSLSSIKTDMDSIKKGIGSLETNLSKLLEKPDVNMDTFRAQIEGMGENLDSLKGALLNDSEDKLSKEDIATMINNSLANLLSDAHKKVLSSSLISTADIGYKPESTSGKTYQEPPVYESTMPDNKETPPQFPANKEISDASESPPEPNDNEEKLTEEQQQDVDPFTPSGS